MNYQPIGLDRFVCFDESISRMRIAHNQHQPGWFGAYVYCLKHGDNDAATLIRFCNMSAEEVERIAGNMNEDTGRMVSNQTGVIKMSGTDEPDNAESQRKLQAASTRRQTERMVELGHNLTRQDAIKILADLATPIDFDQLIQDGVLEREGAWYKLLRPDALPKHAGRQIEAFDTKGRIKFSRSTNRAKKLLKKIGG